MNRRDFTKLMGLSGLALGFSGVPAIACKRIRMFSITMDDFYWQNSVKLTGAERNQAILEALQTHRTKAALFVIGRNIEDEEGKKLLSAWDQAGHLIANHTYSHRNLNAPDADVKAYQDDILQAEALLKQFPRFRKFFRFPFLKEGDTVAKRDAMRAFMTQHGYRNGHVTIDASDWFIDQRLTARLKENPAANVKPYRDYYLEHMWDRANYYDKLAGRVVRHQVRHTMLVHFNLLNSLFLGDLIAMFLKKDWLPIHPELAYGDPVFASQPKVLPAGESLIWSLAKEKRTLAKSLRYPAEDSRYEAARMKRLGL
ncbi:MAG TPA: polysaccharide deacetylase family protein [Pyrinomonadaceae bacterium]|nr:polysaccharide deacetylase family protein [Pyrinomonadaceae bacterium]